MLPHGLEHDLALGPQGLGGVPEGRAVLPRGLSPPARSARRGSGAGTLADLCASAALQHGDAHLAHDLIQPGDDGLPE
eukprot:7121657-Lingulodinium_polyedra.AAC.1